MNWIIILLIILLVAYILFSLFAKITKFLLVLGIILLVGLLAFYTYADLTEEPPIEVEENETIEPAEYNVTLIADNSTLSVNSTGDLL